MVATLICLVTSQVISYIKARAEASGLEGGGGLIERPERLIIVLVGAGFSDLPIHPLPLALPIAMWVLAVASGTDLGDRCRRRRRDDRRGRLRRSSSLLRPSLCDRPPDSKPSPLEGEGG